MNHYKDAILCLSWYTDSVNSEVGACLSNLRSEFCNIILGKYLKREADSFTQEYWKNVSPKPADQLHIRNHEKILYSGVRAGPADGLDFWGST